MYFKILVLPNCNFSAEFNDMLGEYDYDGAISRKTHFKKLHKVKVSSVPRSFSKSQNSQLSYLLSYDI